MAGKNIVVIGAEHPFADRMCRVWRDEGNAVLAARAGGAGNEAAAGTDELERVWFNPLEEASVRAMAAKAGETMGRIDLAIICLDNRKEFALREGFDSGEAMELYDYNALGPLRAIEALLPCMGEGSKRIGLLSDVRDSLTEPMGARHIGYDMALAARRMSVQIMANALGGEGYTFRAAVLDLEREREEPREELAAGACRVLSDLADREVLRVVRME